MECEALRLFPGRVESPVAESFVTGSSPRDHCGFNAWGFSYCLRMLHLSVGRLMRGSGMGVYSHDLHVSGFANSCIWELRVGLGAAVWWIGRELPAVGSLWW